MANMTFRYTPETLEAGRYWRRLKNGSKRLVKVKHAQPWRGEVAVRTLGKDGRWSARDTWVDASTLTREKDIPT